MIVSASYRTDIPAYHGDWFRRRLAAGFAMVANPYGGGPSRVALDGASVDGFVFWTRNPRPFAAALAEVRAQATPFVVQLTVTGYPRALEPSVLATGEAVEAGHAVAAAYGTAALVWRYDPIVLSDLMPPAWHRRRFAELAAGLAGATDEVVVSFVEPYAKTRRHMAAAARAHGFDWQADPPAATRRALATDLAAIAAAQGIRLTLCTQPGLAGPDLPAARCVDADRLARVAGRPVAAPAKGNRPGCLCHRSRDIGAYDTCAQGCVYCYAVGNRPRARAAVAHQDPAAERLG